MDGKSPAVLRRAMGQIVVARALWYVKPGIAELRAEKLEVPRAGDARVKMLFSLISRGTERLVSQGQVPESQWAAMRCPLQSGSFPFPIKYGYSAAGVITAGSETLIGKTVFCLHPHQDFFQVPEQKLVIVPDGIPARRATLAANMETALNAHWDAGTGPSDKILVIGAGTVGLLTAHLAKRMAGTNVTICDIDPGRGEIAEKLGLNFTLVDAAPADNRLVFHTSASAAGLQAAIDHSAFEGRIVEMSWFGAKPVALHLGGAFHSRRLTIMSSQVGHVAPGRRATVTHHDRLALALSLLDDPALDHLVAADVAFEDVAAQLGTIFSNDATGPAPVILYPGN